MPLSPEQLAGYEKQHQVTLELIREFDTDTKHPVGLFRQHLVDINGKPRSVVDLVCPCDCKSTRTLEDFRCVAKNDAREVVKEDLRQKHSEKWASMSLADAAYDIFQMHQAGEYMGEYNSMLFVQTVEELLSTIPDTLPIHSLERKNEQGNVVSKAKTTNLYFPSETILSAINELKKRKLVDLNGLTLVPYREHFRFPDTLHHQFAYWIEEPLGWPNGDAGECFMCGLYGKIAKATGWGKGEDVFGEENIPTLSAYRREHSVNTIALLDSRLIDLNVVNKGEVLQSLTIEQWVAWLSKIQEEIRGTKNKE